MASLPLPFRDDIKLTGRDRQLLGHGGTGEFTLFGSWEFESSKFWSALARVARGKRAKLCSRVDGIERTVWATFIPGAESGSKFPCYELRCDETSEIERLSSAETFLLFDKLSDREKGKEQIRILLDEGADEFEAIWPKVSKIKPARRRMSKLEELKRVSLLCRMQRIRSETDEGNLTLDSCVPAGVRSGLKHLRIKDDYSRSLGERLNSAADCLVQEAGFEIAFDRFSSLPVSLPHSIREGFDAMIPDRRREFGQRFIGAPRSPLMLLHAAKLLLGRSDREELLLGIETIGHLLSESSQSRLKLLQSILRFIAAELSEQEEFASAKLEDRLLAIWIWGAKLADLVSRHSNPLDLAKFFSDHCPNNVDEIFGAKSLKPTDVCDPWNLVPEVFVACGLSWALEGVDLSTSSFESLGSDLEGILLLGQDPAFPEVGLLGNRSGMANLLGSFLDDWSPERLVPLGALGCLETLSPTARLRDFMETVESIVQDPQNMRKWIDLLARGAVSQVPVEACKSLADLADQDLFVDEAWSQDQVIGVSLFIASHCAPQIAGLPHERIEAYFRKTVGALRERGMSESKLAETGLTLCHLLSLVSPSARDNAQRFALLIRWFVDCVPESARAFRKILCRMVPQIEPSVQRKLWRTVFELRYER